MGAVFHIIVILLAAYAVIRGYRRGMIGQVAAVLGLAFGVVAANVFAEPARELVSGLWPSLKTHVGGGFVCSILAASFVYLSVYAVFSTLSKVLRSTMEVIHVGILDSLLGAAFGLLKYMVALSIVYNLILCVSPNSQLLKYGADDDGNVVEGVLLLAPALMGSENVEDLFHRIQRHEARKISCNFQQVPDVIQDEKVEISKA